MMGIGITLIVGGGLVGMLLGAADPDKLNEYDSIAMAMLGAGTIVCSVVFIHWLVSMLI